jgi:ribosomal-protein-alanine N-acetyltransferase
MKIIELQTQRLLLRQWKEQDLAAFAELNSNPTIMEFFPNLLSREQSDTMAQKCQSLIANRGWGLWATELKCTGEFIGYVGLHEPEATLPCVPCTEIGWRLHKRHWGRGYATEAASEVVRFGFQDICLNEIVSFTTIANVRSRAVMERLGMINTNENFEHPSIPANHPLSEHVLYKISRSDWQKLILP